MKPFTMAGHYIVVVRATEQDAFFSGSNTKQQLGQEGNLQTSFQDVIELVGHFSPVSLS